MSGINHYIAVKQSGELFAASGSCIQHALFTTEGLAYYLEAKHELVCAQVLVDGKLKDLVVHYAKDNTGVANTCIIAYVSPLSSSFQDLLAIRYNCLDDLIEAIKARVQTLNDCEGS